MPSPDLPRPPQPPDRTAEITELRAWIADVESVLTELRQRLQTVISLDEDRQTKLQRLLPLEQPEAPVSLPAAHSDTAPQGEVASDVRSLPDDRFPEDITSFLREEPEEGHSSVGKLEALRMENIMPDPQLIAAPDAQQMRTAAMDTDPDYESLVSTLHKKGWYRRRHRIAAARCLAEQGDPQTISHLLQRLLQVPLKRTFYHKEVAAILQSLCRIGGVSPTTNYELETLIHFEYYQERPLSLCLTILSRMVKEFRHRQALVDFLHDLLASDAAVLLDGDISCIFSVLKECGNQSSEAAVLRYLQRRGVHLLQEHGVRRSALELLAQIGSEATGYALLQILPTGSYLVDLDVAEAIGQVGSDEDKARAAEVLLSRWESSSENNRKFNCVSRLLPPAAEILKNVREKLRQQIAVAVSHDEVYLNYGGDRWAYTQVRLDGAKLEKRIDSFVFEYLKEAFDLVWMGSDFVVDYTPAQNMGYHWELMPLGDDSAFRNWPTYASKPYMTQVEVVEIALPHIKIIKKSHV